MSEAPKQGKSWAELRVLAVTTASTAKGIATIGLHRIKADVDNQWKLFQTEHNLTDDQLSDLRSSGERAVQAQRLPA